MRDKYGLPRPDSDEHFGRQRLWARAIEHGCYSDVIAREYGVDVSTVRKTVERYRGGNVKSK